jgi:hypothetical protein
MHSSLALTADGVPVGLAAVKVWTRRKFKGTATLKKKINPPRPERLVRVLVGARLAPTILERRRYLFARHFTPVLSAFGPQMGGD